MSKEIKNYILFESRLSKLSRTQKAAYIDISEYFADEMFALEELSVKFKEEYKKENCSYVIVFCEFKKSEIEKFESAMKRLKNKMILFGHADYEELCEKIMSFNGNMK